MNEHQARLSLLSPLKDSNQGGRFHIGFMDVLAQLEYSNPSD